MPSKIFQI